MKLVIDADACPKSVLQTCLHLCHTYGVPVWTVASFNHRIVSDHHIVVGNEPQAADLKIVNILERDDVCVTQDWGLAAVALGKHADVLHPDGWQFRPETIDFKLEERHAKAKFRRSGGRTKGPKKRGGKDDRRFAERLENVLVHNIKRADEVSE